VLSFTPVAGINGVFDNETGILTFTGRSTTAQYQSLLRTVKFAVSTDPGGRTGATLPKEISFAVYDIDFTNPTPAVKVIEVDTDDGITVYNAVAPNSSGDNKFMRISGLPASNKVSIYNRWG